MRRAYWEGEKSGCGWVRVRVRVRVRVPIRVRIRVMISVGGRNGMRPQGQS